MKAKMQWMVVEPTHVVCGARALCCGNVVKAGQSVLFRRVQADEAANFRFLTFHRRCLVTLLMEGPQDQDAEAFEELRNAIVASGDIFETGRV